MPSLPIIANAVKVGVFWGAGTTKAVITFGVSYSGSDLAALGNIIDGAATAGMWGSVASTVAATELHLFRYDGVTPTFVRAVSGAKWTGSAAAGDASIAPAVLISERTAARGPWARGRMYLPLTSESVMAAGSLLTATVTSMQTAWNAFLAALASGGAPMGVISTATSVGPPPRSPAIRQVTSLVVEANLATQRRRQDRIRG